ncbi:MAG: aminotransferase class V-fold PLP-dependent enzyme [Clostridia bacterium]|nr:aminotransferase class V-fold PLP-dependent enzyme [Clostridia bacterium]
MTLPIYDRLSKPRAALSFHMPTHNFGKALREYPISAKMDVTELFDTDNLHNAAGIIAQSQQKAAKLWGAQNAYYLVNGSSCGVMAMVGAFCSEGDTIIADRYSHRSLCSALVFSGARAKWVRPFVEKGIWCAVDCASLRRAVVQNPRARAIFITAPNYFGMMGDISEYAKIAHEAGMALLVDAAHGAHFGLAESLPPSPMHLGADAAVVGAHKTLNSLTQSAILLSNVKNERMEHLLTMYQSTSPSYLLLSSLDVAVEKAAESLMWDDAVNRVREVFGTERAMGNARYRDPLRLLVDARAEDLRKRFSIEAECECCGKTVCIVSTTHTEQELMRLKHAVKQLPHCTAADVTPPVLKSAVTPREAFFAKKKKVRPEAAVGRICAKDVFAYPPGVPVALCGEIIDESAAAMAEEFWICE